MHRLYLDQCSKKVQTQTRVFAQFSQAIPWAPAIKRDNQPTPYFSRCCGHTVSNVRNSSIINTPTQSKSNNMVSKVQNSKVYRKVRKYDNKKKNSTCKASNFNSVVRYFTWCQVRCYIQITISEGDTRKILRVFPVGSARKWRFLFPALWRNNYTTPSTAIRRKLKNIKLKPFSRTI